MRSTSATSPGDASHPNEDYVLTTPDLVVVLDGATVRTDTGCVHGVAWFVQQLAVAVADHAPDGPADALRAAIATVAKAHRNTCDLNHPGTPSAAVAILHAAGDQLHHLVLGDVTVVLDTSIGLRVFTDDRVSRTALVERATADLYPIGAPAKAQALVAMKHVELAARNASGGYWIATHDPGVVRHAILGSTPLFEVRRAAVLTDGAARAVRLFGLHDWSGLLDVLATTGPAELIAKVRAAESADPTGVHWPRNKASDDATAVYVTL